MTLDTREMTTKRGKLDSYTRYKLILLILSVLALPVIANTEIKKTIPQEITSQETTSHQPNKLFVHTKTVPPPKKQHSISTFPFETLEYTPNDTIEDAKALFCLHDDVDDDDDGNITFSESTEYTKAAKNGGSIGLMASLDDDLDGQITFSELWATWIKSPVHNWTNEQLIQWLVEECEISNSKIIEIFRSKQFTGAVIPKLALHDFSYLKSVGVKSFLLRRRMMLKSMDAVMYGPPRKRHSIYKDIILTFAVLLTFGVIGFAILIRKRMIKQIKLLEEKMTNNDENHNISATNSMDDQNEQTEELNSQIQELMEENKRLIKEKERIRQNSSKTSQSNTVYQHAPPSPEFIRLLSDCKQAEENLVKKEHERAVLMHKTVQEKIGRVHNKKNTFFGTIQLLHGEGLEKLDEEISTSKQQLEKFKRLKSTCKLRWIELHKCAEVTGSRSAKVQKAQSPAKIIGSSQLSRMKNFQSASVENSQYRPHVQYPSRGNQNTNNIQNFQNLQNTQNTQNIQNREHSSSLRSQNSEISNRTKPKSIPKSSSASVLNHRTISNPQFVKTQSQPAPESARYSASDRTRVQKVEKIPEDLEVGSAPIFRYPSDSEEDEDDEFGDCLDEESVKFVATSKNTRPRSRSDLPKTSLKPVNVSQESGANEFNSTSTTNNTVSFESNNIPLQRSSSKVSLSSLKKSMSISKIGKKLRSSFRSKSKKMNEKKNE